MHTTAVTVTNALGFSKLLQLIQTFPYTGNNSGNVFYIASISDVVCKGLNTKKIFSWYCDDHGIEYLSFNFTDISLPLAITFS